MRILHIANFSWFMSKRKRADNLARYYTTDRKITNGLIRNGHCVWDFSYRDTARHLSPLGLGKKLGAKKMNDYFLTLAKKFAPELILLGHCELLTSSTLEALKECLPTCKIAQWWVDQFANHSLPHLRAKQPYLDAFFATSAPEYYRPLIAGKQSPPLYYLPNIVDASIETERAFAGKQHDYDVFFAGSVASEREEILQQVQNLPAVRYGFWGGGGKPALSGSELAVTIGKSKMGLNLSRAIDIPLYSSDRIAQLAGNGCLVLMPRTKNMTMLFTEDEVSYFGDGKELATRIKQLMKDDIAWRTIAEAGWKRAHGSYNERRVAQFVVEATWGGDFSERYEWL